MRYTTSRKYPITHMKKNSAPNEKYLDMSLAAAAGILAFVFANGLFLGYTIKKWMD